MARPPARLLGFFLVLPLACELERFGALAPGTDDAGGGGTGGLPEAAAGGGTWVGGSAGTAGAGAVGGQSGASGAAGAGGIAGAAGTGPDACDHLCVDPNASCLAPGICTCAPGFLSIDTDNELKTATCFDTTLVSATVRVGIGHSHCGHLTLKLRGPDGTVLALASRPGAAEVADDGTGTSAGDESDLHPFFPILFDDTATVDAESMGADVNGGTVCKNGQQVCSFTPSPDSAGGPPSVATAFAGKFAAGHWDLCIGDSIVGVVGQFNSWELTLVMNGGERTLTRPNTTIVIPDGAYDGSPASMACDSTTLGP